MLRVENKLRKGFTLAELAVAIAVIAVLLAVLIPSFIKILDNSENSKDKITVRNFNTLLAASDTNYGSTKNVIDAIKIVLNEGYSLSDLNFKETNNNLIYNISSNRFALYNSSFSSVVYGDISSDDELCVVNPDTDNTDAAYKNGFSVFCYYSTDNAVTLTTDLDITIFLYTEAETVELYTDNATVYHYGYADNVDSKNTKSYTAVNEEANENNDSKTEHIHTMGEIVVITQPTCTKCGTSRSYCSGCDYYEEYTIDKLDHNYETTITEPTVDSPGCTTYTCTYCEVSYIENSTYLYTTELEFELSEDNSYYFISGITDTSVKDIYIPSYYNNLPVKEIADKAFYENTTIENVTIGKSVEVIGDYAFYGCTSLKTVNIPCNVTSLGTMCFSSCTGLTEVYYCAIDASCDTEYTFAKSGYRLYNINQLIFYISADVLSIPDGLFNYVSDGYNAHVYAVIFEEGSKCTTIGTYAFKDIGLSYIILPSSITTRGYNPFADNSGVTIFFTGTETDWTNYVLNYSCDFINKKSAIYYYSEEEKTGCWHYVNGLPVLW